MVPLSLDDSPEILPSPGHGADIVFELESCRVPEYRIEVRSSDSGNYFWLTAGVSGKVIVREQDGPGALQGRRPTSRPTRYFPTEIYYATDRQRLSSRKADFINKRSESGRLSRGRLTVSVAKEESTPEPVVPPLAPELFPSETPLSRDGLRAEISARPGAQRDVLVFVHGFRVTFSDAVQAAAGLAQEIKFGGPVIAYSWPSEFNALKYVADLDHSRLSAIDLQEFFEELADTPNVGRLHVVAHSMGSDAVLEAVVRASLKSKPTRFGHLIFVAADVDPDRFARVVPAIRAVSDSVTLYVSSRDWALNLSEGLRAGARRLGDAGPAVVVAGVDTIDASDTRGRFGHSYYVDPRLVRDIRSLLVENRLARDRGLLRVEGAQGVYYKLP